MRNLKDKKCKGVGTVKVREHYVFLENYFKWKLSPEKFDFWQQLSGEWSDMLEFLLEKDITVEMIEYKKFLEGEN